MDNLHSTYNRLEFIVYQWLNMTLGGVIFSSNYLPNVESARSTSDDRDALGLAPQAPSSLGQSSLGPRCAQSPGNALIKMHDLA